MKTYVFMCSVTICTLLRLIDRTRYTIDIMMVLIGNCLFQNQPSTAAGILGVIVVMLVFIARHSWRHLRIETIRHLKKKCGDRNSGPFREYLTELLAQHCAYRTHKKTRIS